MNTNEARELVSSFSYKPGHVFRVTNDPFLPGIIVQVETEPRQDSFAADEKLIPIFGNRGYSPQKLSMMSPEMFANDIFDKLVVGLEKHEAAEWFKVDGLLLRDAHADSLFRMRRPELAFEKPVPKHELSGISAMFDDEISGWLMANGGGGPE